MPPGCKLVLVAIHATEEHTNQCESWRRASDAEELCTRCRKECQRGLVELCLPKQHGSMDWQECW